MTGQLRLKAFARRASLRSAAADFTGSEVKGRELTDGIPCRSRAAAEGTPDLSPLPCSPSALRTIGRIANPFPFYEPILKTRPSSPRPGGSRAMSRFRTALAFLLWAIGAAANAQGPPIPTEAQVAVAPQPLPSSAPFLASLDDESAPSPPAAPAAPAASTQPAAPSDAEKTAAAIEKLSKSVETISKNLTVVTADEQIKLVVGGVISADFLPDRSPPAFRSSLRRARRSASARRRSTPMPANRRCSPTSPDRSSATSRPAA
jgi:hypothetical protein